MNKLAVWVGAAALGTVGLAAGACGNSGSDDGAADIELRDFSFAPSAFKADAGEELSLDVRNVGATAHTFTIDGGVDQELAPGRAETMQVTAPRTGSVVYYCRFHRGQGMEGTIQVEGATSPAPTPTTASGGYGY
jgi:plastocyanin